MSLPSHKGLFKIIVTRCTLFLITKKVSHFQQNVNKLFKPETIIEQLLINELLYTHYHQRVRDVKTEKAQEQDWDGTLSS